MLKSQITYRLNAWLAQLDKRQPAWREAAGSNPS